MSMPMEMEQCDFTLSIVSHGQAELTSELLADLARLKPKGVKEIILTINIPEDETLLGPDISIVDHIIRNITPKGFGANHNAAFEHSTSRIFVIVNPDIRLSTIDFDDISSVLQDLNVGACAPLVTNADGNIEDSFRHFPSVFRLLKRILFRDRHPDYELPNTPLEVDWAAGMFVAYSTDAFRKIGGFDERYFMYMEDADICRRLRNSNFKVILQPSVTVIHNAQRASTKNWRYFFWHLRSAIRFLFTV